MKDWVWHLLGGCIALIFFFFGYFTGTQFVIRDIKKININLTEMNDKYFDISEGLKDCLMRYDSRKN